MTAHRAIELIAPSGYVYDHAIAARAVERLRDQGHTVINTEAMERRSQRFAGTDAQRAAELNRLADPARNLPDIVLAVRGGYGAVRLLHGLDYAGLRQRLTGQPIAIVGHSDFTALQMALYARAGLMTFGGPMLVSDFGAPVVSAYTMEHFWQAITRPSFTLQVNAPQVQQASVSGTLWGGNLAVLAALAGTPYMPQIRGGILFLEDINELTFRLERTLYQLHLSGILARQQAIVLGDLSGGKIYESDNGYDVPAMVQHLRSLVGIPVITGLPFGHIADLATLPFGAHARLNARAHGFTLEVSGYPHLRG